MGNPARSMALLAAVLAAALVGTVNAAANPLPTQYGTGMLAALLAATLVGTGNGAANPLPPQYDTALPTLLKVCVQAYPPFVMQRVRARVGRGETGPDGDCGCRQFSSAASAKGSLPP